MRGLFKGRRFVLVSKRSHKQEFTMSSSYLNTCVVCDHSFETIYRNETSCLSCAFKVRQLNVSTRMNVLDDSACEDMAREILTQEETEE